MNDKTPVAATTGADVARSDERNAVHQNTRVPGNAHARMVAMLSDPTALFDRSQAAFLMAAAARWAREEEYARGVVAGSEQGRAELGEMMLEALSRPQAAPLTEQWHRMEGYRRDARREFYAAAVHPWRGDHPGGAVPAWDYPPEVYAPVVRRNAELKAGR